MKKRFRLQSAIYIFVLPLLFLWGCGGSGPGSPGSQGTESTGLIVDVSLAPIYGTTNTSNVDTYQQTCDSTTTPVTMETFTDHNATLTLSTRWLNSNAKNTPGYLYIEKYTVEYRRSEDSIGAPPIQQDVVYQTITITPPSSGTATASQTATVALMDLTRKSKYYTDVTSGQYSSHTSAYINNYTATYVFEGQNQYGVSFTLNAQTSIAVGSYDNCQ